MNYAGIKEYTDKDGDIVAAILYTEDGQTIILGDPSYLPEPHGEGLGILLPPESNE